MTVINENELQVLGVKKNSIFPLALTVNTVTKKSIDLICGTFLKFSAYDAKSSSTRTSRQLCYVSTAVSGIYLSEEACIDLGYVTDIQNDATISAIETRCSNRGVGQKRHGVSVHVDLCPLIILQNCLASQQSRICPLLNSVFWIDLPPQHSTFVKNNHSR